MTEWRRAISGVKISKTGVVVEIPERRRLRHWPHSHCCFSYDFITNRWLGTREGQRLVRQHRTNKSHLYLWNDVLPAIIAILISLAKFPSRLMTQSCVGWHTCGPVKAPNTGWQWCNLVNVSYVGRNLVSLPYCPIEFHVRVASARTSMPSQVLERCFLAKGNFCQPTVSRHNSTVRDSRRKATTWRERCFVTTESALWCCHFVTATYGFNGKRSTWQSNFSQLHEECIIGWWMFKRTPLFRTVRCIPRCRWKKYIHVRPAFS